MTAPTDKTKEYGRRPYINSDPNEAAHPDEMEEILDKAIFDYQLQKHSEFKKPYITPDFHEMEYYWTGFPGISFPDPDFDWPWDFPDNQPVPDLVLSGSCVVRITSPLYCENPAQGYPMLYSGPKESLKFKVSIKEGNGSWSGYRRWSYDPTKGIWPLEVQPPTGGWNSFPDPDQHSIRVEMEDAFETVCSAEVSIVCYGASCCTDPAYVAPTNDTSITPETIVPGNSITVAVLGGCAPFSWVVSGAGYSFAKAVTQSSRSNTLSLVDEPCGAGADALGTITITDDCGTVVTTEIRNTEARWILCQSGSGGPAICVGPETITLGKWQVTYTCGVGPTNYCNYREGFTYTCEGESLDWPWFNTLNLCGDDCHYNTVFPAGWKCGANKCCFITMRSTKVWGC